MSTFIQTMTTAFASHSIVLVVVICSIFFVALVITGTYTVLTARTRAESKVKALVKALDDLILQLNEAEKIGNFGSFAWNFDNQAASYWSDEMYTLLGLVHRNTPPTIADVIKTAHAQDKDSVTAEWERAQTQPGSFSFIFRSVALNGQMRYLRIQATTVLGDDKKPRLIQGVAHDITKEIEVDQAKTEFVSLASHQLKTPLTTIKWMTEALLNGSVGALLPDQQQYITNIQQAGQRMIEMVNDLLNVSRIELNTLSLQQEEIDVCDLAQGVVDEQKHTADEKKLSVKLICDPSLPHIHGDKNLIRMVFQNLVSNAIKYTPANGSVECEITASGVMHKMIYIRVTDTGIGIPKDEWGRVFEKLHRASNAQMLIPDGTGLGLYVVKTIVDHAGGKITFESEVNKGTTFNVSLPIQWQSANKKTTVVETAK